MSRIFTAKVIKDFSKAAQTYDSHAILQRKVADKLFNIFHAINGTILDIGCGTGYFHELLRKNKFYLPLVQVDISHSMCKVAAHYASPPEYGGTYTATADIQALPFGNNSFANIFSSMTIQWAEDRKKAFSEAQRVLQDNGSFAFSIVGNGSLAELAEAFSLSGHAPTIHSFANKQEIERELVQAGFSIKQIYSETITMFYKDIYELIRAIKGVGASYKGKMDSGLKGKGYFAEVEKIYRDKFTSAEGLQVSWNIIFVQASK